MLVEDGGDLSARSFGNVGNRQGIWAVSSVIVSRVQAYARKVCLSTWKMRSVVDLLAHALTG